MKKALFLLFLLVSFNGFAQSGRKFHKRAIVVDTHGDILSDQIKSGIDVGKRQNEGNFDLIRANEGGLDVQVFSIWSDHTGSFHLANRQIDSLDALIKRYPNLIAKVRNPKELKIKDEISEHLLDLPENVLDVIMEIVNKSHYVYPEKTNNEVDDLPF
jgi:membrane dipeptidase